MKLTDQERRAEHRTTHRGLVILAYGDAERTSTFEGAELTDCSKHGIRILFHRPLDEDFQFFVRLNAGHGMEFIPYAVRNCMAMGQNYSIGAVITPDPYLLGVPSPEAVYEILRGLPAAAAAKGPDDVWI